MTLLYWQEKIADNKSPLINMTLKELLTEEPTSSEADSQGFAKFIKFKMEPVFEYTLYVIGIVIILAGAIDAVALGVNGAIIKKKRTPDEVLTMMRIRLSETISLGLTFILGAEVIKTFRVPNIYQLIKVALLVLLRQLITYFLDRDVARLRKEFPNLMKTSK